MRLSAQSIWNWKKMECFCYFWGLVYELLSSWHPADTQTHSASLQHTRLILSLTSTSASPWPGSAQELVRIPVLTQDKAPRVWHSNSYSALGSPAFSDKTVIWSVPKAIYKVRIIFWSQLSRMPQWFTNNLFWRLRRDTDKRKVISTFR